MIELELEMATSMLGPVRKEYREKLRQLHDDPTPERWGDCHGIIVNGEGEMLTLWQALVVIDPENTPRTGPSFGAGEEAQWNWCPTQGAIRAALCYATH